MEHRPLKIGRVYKITSPQTKSVYIGSTFQSLRQRWAVHQHHYRYYMEGSGYTSACDILRFVDAEMSLVEELGCQTDDDLLRREQYHIDITLHSVNRKKVFPRFSQAQWLADHPDYHRQYKERLPRTSCECGAEVAKYQLAKHLSTDLHWRRSQKVR